MPGTPSSPSHHPSPLDLPHSQTRKTFLGSPLCQRRALDPWVTGVFPSQALLMPSLSGGLRSQMSPRQLYGEIDDSLRASPRSDVIPVIWAGIQAGVQHQHEVPTSETGRFQGWTHRLWSLPRLTPLASFAWGLVRSMCWSSSRQRAG